jgi:hypothetical protein
MRSPSVVVLALALATALGAAACRQPQVADD